MLGAAFAFCVFAGVLGSAESPVDLFVTDYNQPQSADMQPLAGLEQTFTAPRRVVVEEKSGRRRTFDSPQQVTVKPRLVADPRSAYLFATPGEYEPFSFLLKARENLPEVFITAGPLRGPGGAVIPPASVVIASVESFHGGGRRILVPLGRKWNMGAFTTELFWYTVKVPERTRPGLYRGEVSVSSAGRIVGWLQVTLEVLPFRLQEPPYSLGLNYSWPGDTEVLAAHLSDMRRHGMTTVAPLYGFHLPVFDKDTSQIGTFFEAFKKAGFPGVLYLASTLSLHTGDLAGFGDVTSKRWQQKYIEVMLRIYREADRHGVPFIMSIADELTNKGLTGVEIARKLARFVWEELPEIPSTSDMNGYREVMAMAPYLNVATFNNGWDGIDHHNAGRHLINRRFIEELKRKTGAIPWFVNGGVGRFPFGFFFWKMAGFGVRGKVEWYYNLRNERGSLVRTEGRRVYPTLDYERCREGIDDLKYLLKLERLAAQAEALRKAARERRKAVELLDRISKAIVDDWTAYQTGSASFPDPGADIYLQEEAVKYGPFNAVRKRVADCIVELKEALER